MTEMEKLIDEFRDIQIDLEEEKLQIIKCQDNVNELIPKLKELRNKILFHKSVVWSWSSPNQCFVPSWNPYFVHLISFPQKVNLGRGFVLYLGQGNDPIAIRIDSFGEVSYYSDSSQTFFASTAKSDLEWFIKEYGIVIDEKC